MSHCATSRLNTSAGVPDAPIAALSLTGSAHAGGLRLPYNELLNIYDPMSEPFRSHETKATKAGASFLRYTQTVRPKHKQ